MTSSKSEVLFERAWTIYEEAHTYNHQSKMRDAASFLLAAIKSENNSYPEAEVILADVYMMLRDYKSAEKYADSVIANGDDDIAFHGQLIKTRIALIHFKRVDGLDGWARAAESGTLGFLGTLFVTGNSQERFSQEWKKLLKKATTLLSTSINSAFFIFLAENLMQMADVLSQHNIKGSKDVYALITNVSPDIIEYDEKEHVTQVEYIQTVAEGRLYL